MFTREFSPARFLSCVARTTTFRDFCRTRRVPYDSTVDGTDDRRWAAALASLPPEARARIELELAMVTELSGDDGTAHLLAAAAGGPLPPDDVPGGAGVALWFLLHRPDLLHGVFLHHESGDDLHWRRAKAAAAIVIDDLDRAGSALAEGLREVFRHDAGSGRFCVVDARRLPAAVCFVARVADRTRLVEAFTDTGEAVVHALQPALTVLFTYTPRDGAVMLKSAGFAPDLIRRLFECFGRTVLGAPVACGGAVFDLDRLKQPFHPLPDAADMESVRLRSIHLRYPSRLGRRCLKLETLGGDEPDAVEQMLRAHASADAPELTVSHAELQVRLRIDGRCKKVRIRLWRDRCDLGHTPLGDRLRACLLRWGLCDA
ncbi:MAG TPA: hypothetical protein VD866_19085 [Urbifossiella sp.]|nr:hypothetical protein [Urbifossiella sp.]